MAQPFDKAAPPTRRKPLTRLVQTTLHIFESPDCNGPPIASFETEFTVVNGSGPSLPALGHLFLKGKHVGTIQGAFPAEILESPKSPGAPKKTARDVGIYCAFALSRARRHGNGDNSVIRAREDVLAMWKRKHFPGLHDERTVAARLRLSHVKKAAEATGVEIIYLPAQRPAYVFLFEHKSKWTIYGDCALVAGSGWVWIEGNQEAYYSPAFKPMQLSWPASEGATDWVDEFRRRVNNDSRETFIIHEPAE